MKALPITLFFLIINFSGCGKEDDNSTIYNYEVSVDEQFQVDLISNPSTGYSWVWINKQAVSIIDSIGFNFIPDTPVMAGSGGTEIWTLKAVSRGIDTMKFEYCRFWEPNSTIDTKSIVVKVK